MCRYLERQADYIINVTGTVLTTPGTTTLTRQARHELPSERPTRERLHQRLHRQLSERHGGPHRRRHEVNLRRRQHRIVALAGEGRRLR
jgi:hypothetical protein